MFPGQHHPTQHPHSDAIAVTYPHTPAVNAQGSISISIPSCCSMVLCVQRPGSKAVIWTSRAETEQAWEGAWQGWVFGWVASPREITLFWAWRDDVMTDGDEDVGADGRKRYLPQWHQEDGDANTCGTHYRSMILYSSGLEEYCHSLLNPSKQEHTHTSDMPGFRRWLSFKKLKSDS